MKEIFTTDRLRIRELNLHDTDFIIQLVNTPGWLKYIGDRNIKSEEQATRYLVEGPLTSYQENGFGLWLAELKENGQPIGMCGLLRRDYLDYPDIGFAFLPHFIGKGYAFEAAKEIISLGFTQFKLEKMCAITVPDNHLSIKLLEKIGMQYSHRIQAPVTHDELSVYCTHSYKSL
jgi:RimJ/RimL family protein N-acetyltransferase